VELRGAARFSFPGDVSAGGEIKKRSTVTVAEMLISATLVARTVTVCVVAIVAGAVYNPALEIVPVLGLNDHVTAVLFAFATVAENCCVCEA
jgi:hypothetical protein